MDKIIKEIQKPDILCEVLEGLSMPQKHLPSKLFYDEKGSRLFDQICELKEYYLTRTEMEILKNNIDEIGALLGEGTLLVEPGSGSSVKIRLLLDHISGLAGYIPIDISKEHLMYSSELLKKDYPDLDIYPVAADYTKNFPLPHIRNYYDHVAVYYPGSTIGNFTPLKAKKFLGSIAKICGKNGRLVIGVDLKKSKDILEPAYNDSKGVTAEFNLNILERINNDAGSDFDVSKFRHNSFYNEDEGRIEMHLESNENQTVRLNGSIINFEKGEDIITEYSYKYTPEEFRELVSDFFEIRKIWMDKDRLFSIQYLRVK